MRFKPQKFLTPHGAAVKMSKDLGINAITIRRVLNGKVERVVSHETAELIYANAPLYGGVKVKQ